MEQALKRISLMIRADQYDELANRGLNVSGLVRDLVDDHLSDYKITLGVSEETRLIYDKIVANSGATDEDLEIYLKRALKELLGQRIEAMKELHATL